MKIRRDIASIPKRSASQTWSTITDLITGPDSVDAKTLTAAASIMESLITDEHPGKYPITIKGVGNRLVIYLAFNEDAMEVDSSVDSLNWNPTAGQWTMTAPCDPEDAAWMNKALQERAPRITVHDVNTPPADEDDTEAASKARTLKVNWGALGS